MDMSLPVLCERTFSWCLAEWLGPDAGELIERGEFIFIGPTIAIFLNSEPSPE
jgi:hypothetical protein